MFNSWGMRGAHASTSSDRHAVDGGFIVDAQGTILGFDEAMEQLTGWPAVEVVGRNKNLARSLAAETRLQRRPAALYDGEVPVPDESRNIELCLQCRDGSTVDVEALATRLPGRGDRVSVNLLRLVARSGGPRWRGRRAGIDPLTGLRDRAAFVSCLSEAFRSAEERGRPLGLILADVDHLRRVNDRLGRDAGDTVLKKLAGILRASIEDEDGIARVGDDDFAILLRDAGRGEARQTSARLRSTVERFHFFRAPEADVGDGVTLSLGAASFPADAETCVDLMKRASEALDEARALGRNRVWCYTRRPRVPVAVPVYFDATEALLVGYTRDLSPSGVFVQTSAPVEVGMRCALAFPLPDNDDRVHVVGRVVRTVPPERGYATSPRIPGMGIEFERFGPEDRRAIEHYLHTHEHLTSRPERMAPPA